MSPRTLLLMPPPAGDRPESRRAIQKEIERWFHIWRLTGSDEDARRWIEIARPNLWRIAFRICRQRQDAEDALQNAMRNVLLGVDAFRSDCAVFTWLYRIVVHCSVDTHLERKRHPTVAPADVAEAWDVLLPAHVTAATSDPRADAVRAEVLRLPEPLREALLLVTVRGLTGKEAARALSIPVGTLQWRVFKARHRIREALRLRGILPRGR